MHFLHLSTFYLYYNISNTVNLFNLVLPDQITSGQHPERQFTPGNRMRLLSLPCFIHKLTYTISAFKDQMCYFEPKLDYKIKNETSITLEKQYAMSGVPHWLLYRNTSMTWFTDFCGIYGGKYFPSVVLWLLCLTSLWFMELRWRTDLELIAKVTTNCSCH